VIDGNVQPGMRIRKHVKHGIVLNGLLELQLIMIIIVMGHGVVLHGKTSLIMQHLIHQH